ncbi:MAG: hypothetical protein JWO35_255 [Candidatus Saccharibacteria bacterium]|nr:hypothetical protein [Candidatus Saccharibacteria bacterium]
MDPDELDEEEQLEQRTPDMESPFAPAHPRGDISDTHPSTDTGIDQDELYEEGISGAAEAAEPNPDDDVVGYEEPNKGK